MFDAVNTGTAPPAQQVEVSIRFTSQCSTCSTYDIFQYLVNRDQYSSKGERRLLGLVHEDEVRVLCVIRTYLEYASLSCHCSPDAAARLRI